MQVFYYDASSGHCLGTYGPGTTPPANALPATSVPDDGRQVWNGTAWAWPVETIRQHVIEAVALRYEAALADGLPYAGKVLQIREQDQANLTTMGNEARWTKAAGAAWPADFAWRMADDSFLPVATADAMIALGEAAKAEVYRLRRVKWSHVDTLLALTSSAEIAAYNLETGW